MLAVIDPKVQKDRFPTGTLCSLRVFGAAQEIGVILKHDADTDFSSNCYTAGTDSSFF